MGKFEEIQKIDDADELQAALKVNAILNDMSVEELLESPLADVSKMSKAREFLGKMPIKRITKKKYVLGGNPYIFNGDIYAITTAQFIDLQNTEKEDIVSALAIFLIPEGKSYNKGYDIDDVKADIRKFLSAEEGLSIASFFTIALDLLYRRALRRAKRMLKKAKRQGVQTEQAEQLLKEAPKTLQPENYTFG